MSVNQNQNDVLVSDLQNPRSPSEICTLRDVEIQIKQIRAQIKDDLANLPSDQDIEEMRLIGLNYAKKYAELKAKRSEMRNKNSEN